MKKFLALALALAMIFSLCACGETATTATEAPKAEEAAPAAEEAAAKTEYKVGVAIYQFDDNFMTLYRNELESYMKSLETDDMKFDITIVDGKNDMAEQTNQINNFITQGMDAIILNLVQTSSADSVIDSIVAAGIPCILINREPLGDNGDESYKGILDNAGVCYVGADARQSGTFQGEIVAELPNHGDINGDGKISYIMIEGDPENVDAQYRTEFSVKALTDAGYEVEELDDQVGNWAQAKGQEITANDLAKFGDAIEVVFCNNDAMALGAAAAIEAAGRVVGQDIYLLGVDALDECVEMVNNGTMTGTVLNDAVGQSHAAVDAAVKALKGEAIDNYYWVDYVKVAAEATEAAPAAEAAEPMTYADFVAAAIDDPVCVECYAQAHESWWDGKVTVYAADKDGAYLLYDLACSEEDAAKLEGGAKILVNGYKAEWSGEVEIADGTFEFVDGEAYVAPAFDATALFGTDELIAHMNELIAVKGLKIAEDVDSAWDCSSDLYISATLNDAPVTFTLRRYLTDNESEAYAQVKDLKAGDVIDVEAYLYWYEEPQARIIKAEAAK